MASEGTGTESTDDDWFQLAVEIPGQLEEAFLNALGTLAGAGVVVLDEAAKALHPELSELSSGWIRVIVYARADDLPRYTAGLTHAIEGLAKRHQLPPSARFLGCDAVASGWRDRWREFFHVSRVSERLTIRPTWEHHVPRPGEVIIDLDPGTAFGTGGHATTMLCLQALDSIGAPRRVLDVGTGSGVLAVAAAKLGARQIVAIDVEEEAVTVARENAAVNAVSDLIAVSAAPLEDVHGEYDLVLANIIASVLLRIGEGLRDRLAPDGTLVVSGVLAEEASGLIRRYGTLELTCVAKEAMGGWVALSFRRV